MRPGKNASPWLECSPPAPKDLAVSLLLRVLIALATESKSSSSGGSSSSLLILQNKYDKNLKTHNTVVVVLA